MKKIILLLLCTVLLAGCTDAPPEVTTAATEAPTVPTTQATEPIASTVPTEPPIVMYADAVEAYLLPLEEYSWERIAEPQFIMLHFTSNVVNDRNDPFNMDAIRQIFVDYNLSVHYIIARDGTVYCYTPEDRVAWHAGAGEFMNDPKYTNDLNQYAIGIEMAAIGTQEEMAQYLTEEEYNALDEGLLGFSEAQYLALERLIHDLCVRYGIPMDRQHIIGHDEYSPTKTDPGDLFDWDRLFPEE